MHPICLPYPLACFLKPGLLKDKGQAKLPCWASRLSLSVLPSLSGQGMVASLTGALLWLDPEHTEEESLQLRKEVSQFLSASLSYTAIVHLTLHQPCHSPATPTIMLSGAWSGQGLPQTKATSQLLVPLASHSRDGSP